MPIVYLSTCLRILLRKYFASITVPIWRFSSQILSTKLMSTLSRQFRDIQLCVPQIFPVRTIVSSSDGKVEQSQPILGLKHGKALFTRRVTLLTEADRQLLNSKVEVSAKQTSPCIITVTYGSVKHVCQFPYPLEGQASSIRVARKSGWIEVSAPLAVPKNPNGGYSSALTPLTKQPGSDTFCSWNLPSINFKQLYRIDDSDPKKIAWLNGHLGQVFSDTELQKLEDSESNPLIGFKVTSVRYRWGGYWYCLSEGVG